MSKTYSIACKDCRKHLWVAQGSHDTPKKGHLYNSKLYSTKHFEFLIDHIGHNLVFDENYDEPISEFEEIEVEGGF